MILLWRGCINISLYFWQGYYFFSELQHFKLCLQNISVLKFIHLICICSAFHREKTANIGCLNTSGVLDVFVKKTLSHKCYGSAYVSLNSMAAWKRCFFRASSKVEKQMGKDRINGVTSWSILVSLSDK